MSWPKSRSRVSGTKRDEVAEGRLTDFRYGRLDPRREGQRASAFSTLSEDDICFMTAYWRIPTECTLEQSDFEGRHWVDVTLAWKASAVCHKPLYFEEVQLERYGHSAGPFVQPVSPAPTSS